MKAVIENLAGFFRALGRRFEPVHDDDEALFVLNRRADDGEASVRDVARLEPIRSDIHGEERIAIELVYLVPGEILLAEVMVVLLIVANDVRCQERHVARSDVLARIELSARIGEMRMGHAEFGGALVHNLGEIVFRAGDSLCQRDGGVVP